MYALIIIAFLIYITKIPERWFVGKVDFAGHSHNWWHLFVLAALYYWHNSGKLNASWFTYHVTNQFAQSKVYAQVHLTKN